MSTEHYTGRRVAKNRINFGSTSNSGHVVEVEQPSVDDVYSEHFERMNEEAKAAIDTDKIIRMAIDGNEVNIPDGEDEPVFKRSNPEELKAADKKHLENMYHEFDEKERPKIEKKMRPATVEDEEAMNEMARKLFGAEI